MRLEYKDNEGFNSYVDGSNEQVQIFELTYRASEVLFLVDQQAYRDLLASYEPVSSESEAARTANLASSS